MAAPSATAVSGLCRGMRSRAGPRPLRALAAEASAASGAFQGLSCARRGVAGASTTRGVAVVSAQLPGWRRWPPAQLEAPAAGAAKAAATSAAPSAPRQRGFASGTGAQFEKQLMPEDILQLRATSMTIMQDPVCELRPEEAQRYIVDHVDPIMDLPPWHPKRVATQVTQPFRGRKLAVARYQDLIVERLDNEPLLSAFGIDTGFNMQVYFMILHAWLLHQRLVLEGSRAKALDKELFESCWTLVRNFMWLKKVPEYRFDAELRNVQEYMLGCCVNLDKALERPDILPARLQQVLWANVYSGSVKRDAGQLTHLTKYILRQLGLMLQLEAECFLSGSFVWADFPVSDEPPRRLALPAWREEFSKIRRET